MMRVASNLWRHIPINGLDENIQAKQMYVGQTPEAMSVSREADLLAASMVSLLPEVPVASSFLRIKKQKQNKTRNWH